MTQILKIALLVLGSVLLQTTLSAKVSVLGNKPDLPLALTVSIALLRGTLWGELVGFSSGLLCDLSSGGPFIGVEAFSKTLIGYFVGFMRNRFYPDNFVTQSLSGFAGTIAGKLITFLHLSLLLAVSPGIHFLGLILVAIVNSILVSIVFQIVKKSIKSRTQWA